MKKNKKKRLLFFKKIFLLKKKESNLNIQTQECYLFFEKNIPNEDRTSII